MNNLSISLPLLRNMIGRHVVYHGYACRIIEILEEQMSLVLQISTNDTIIQPNQFGDAHRRVSETFIIPVFTADQMAFHPEFLTLELL